MNYEQRLQDLEGGLRRLQMELDDAQRLVQERRKAVDMQMGAILMLREVMAAQAQADGQEGDDGDN